MPTLYLVRHGQTDWNSEGRLQGHADRPLNTIGRIQATAVGHRLASVPVDAIYASDLVRAMATARAIAVYHGLAVIPERRMREVSYGDWEGEKISDLAKRYPQELAGWRSDPPTYLPPGAEPQHAVRQRVSAFLQEMYMRPPDEQIVLVAHGNSLRVLLSLISPWPDSRRQRPVVDTASLTKVILSPSRGAIVMLNDRSHLLEVDELMHVAAPIPAGHEPVAV
ncbi:MAG: histidine phosphatase family protein [Anaerolineae bacterium]